MNELIISGPAKDKGCGDAGNLDLKMEALKIFIDNTEAGLYIADYYSGEVLFANRKMASYTKGKYSAEELAGMRCWSIVYRDNDQRCSFCPYEKIVDENGKPTEPYTWELNFPEHELWLQCINQAVYWTDGRLAHMVTFVDITENKRMMAEMEEMRANLEYLAYVDQHLKLKNGVKLEKDIKNKQPKPSLIVFDLLALQKINEAYGRDFGDSLLIEVRDWIMKIEIPNSELYRVEGDEFCLTVEDISTEMLRTFADRIVKRFRDSWMCAGGDGFLQLFCGVTVGVVDGSFIKDDKPLLNLIERTLKTAKEIGRIAVYNDEMDKRYRQRLQFEFSLKRCVMQDMQGFDVYYQPIADPIIGTWCGLEALCRWNSPELGPMSPQLFIPEAERLELIGTIGIWALETAVSKCKKWGLDKLRRFIIDVNLSAIQFLDEELSGKIVQILRDYDFPGEKLCLEITESTQFTFSDLSLQTINSLRENNVLVALDDFGTGYSAFNNLKSLPVDIVKVEKVFTKNIESDSYQQYLFHAISELAHAADMKVVAEGVEYREQMDILLKNGADFLQGYLFSMPLPPSDLENMLNRFEVIDQSFNYIRSRKIDIRELIDVESNYILTHRMYKVLNRGMRILFCHTDEDEAISRVIRIVGMHLNVSRTYVFLHDYNEHYSSAQEWCAQDIVPKREAYSRIPLSEYWVERLKKDGIVYASDISDLPDELSSLLREDDVKSVIVLPLWDEDRLLGFVGCEDCLYCRDWRPEEIILLHSLCVIITGILSKRILKDEAQRRDEILSGVLNQLELLVHVSDVETGEILFANQAAKHTFGADIEGKICWEVFHGRQDKCEFCKACELLERGDESEYVVEYFNPTAKSWYKVYESLIPWTGGKKAHLEYCAEIPGQFE